MSFTEPEVRPVLGPAGNKARSVELKKPTAKLKVEKTQMPLEIDEAKVKITSPVEKVPSLRKMGIVGNAASSFLRRNLSMSASCSSDASSDSSSASIGRISSSRNGSRRSGALNSKRRQQCGERIERIEGNGKGIGGESEGKRCAWVTSKTDPAYAAFHDEEWGLPVHDDKQLFELLSFSTALAELSWPVILSKRHIFRDVFMDFDPVAVSKLNEKKFAAPGSPASSLLSEAKLRAVIENARQICKIIDEMGSFDKYIWGFANYKPIVGNFRYPRQVPIKTSKADTISKDLVRRGFRGVGPTVVYSFMQVAGITNDHLINCFRYHDCINAVELRDKNEGVTSKNEVKSPEDITELKGDRDIDDLSLSR